REIVVQGVGSPLWGGERAFERGGRNVSSWWREIVRICDGVVGQGGGWFGDCVRKKVGDGLDTFFWTDPWVGVQRGGVGVEETVMGVGGGDVGVVSDFTSQLSFLQAQSPDLWQCQPDPVKGYSVRGANYQLLTSQQHDPLDTVEDQIWHRQVSLKVSIFAWRLLRDRLPTKVNLAIRGIITPEAQSCVYGCGGVESAQHLFFSCSTFGSLWSSVRSWIDLLPVDPQNLLDHFFQFTHSSGGLRGRRSFL
ncbi:70 kDa peptidyl-prolyl isomerase, partial [Trifolium medium]|nr:70 kDa peptidyl-prolyl isomerase [Trifolium medium]